PREHQRQDSLRSIARGVRAARWQRSPADRSQVFRPAESRDDRAIRNRVPSAIQPPAPIHGMDGTFDPAYGPDRIFLPGRDSHLRSSAPVESDQMSNLDNRGRARPDHPDCNLGRYRGPNSNAAPAPPP